MSVRRTVGRSLLLLGLGLGLCACSGGEEDGGAEREGKHLHADVAFARQSVVQHAETLLLVDEAARRGVSPPVAAVVDEIRAQRTADVEALTDLLEGWGEPVPATARDHAHADRAEGLDELRGERGAEFEEAWLDLMADEHDDALDLAETEVEEGRDADAVALAREMARGLERRVAELERLADRIDD